MQLGLFTEKEILTGEDLEKYKAKEYTAKSIYHSSGLGNQIKGFLSNNDKENALKVFDKAFRTYGFGIPNSYSFSCYKRVGKIRYYIESEERFVDTDSKRLFDVLLRII